MQRQALTQVAQLFRTLGEPTRLEILHTLQSGESSVSALVAALGAKQANVSKQLGILKTHGLVMARREGITIYYSIVDPMIFELCQLVCGKFHRDAKRTLKSLTTVKRRSKK
jgi:DNA-binding transcriptional ArsR family regulator